MSKPLRDAASDVAYEIGKLPVCPLCCKADRCAKKCAVEQLRKVLQRVNQDNPVLAGGDTNERSEV